jgi:hypothetical protein
MRKEDESTTFRRLSTSSTLRYGMIWSVMTFGCCPRSKIGDPGQPVSFAITPLEWSKMDR